MIIGISYIPGDKNEIEFKLEHCECTRKIHPGPPKIVVDKDGNEKVRGNGINFKSL